MEMDFEQRKKAIKDKFGKLDKAKKLISGTQKTRDFSSNTALIVAREIIKSHLINGKTEVPISFKEYATEIGYSNITDFNHYRDKMLRLFEVACIVEIGLEDVKAFTGLYKTENTNLIRKHLVRNKHTKLVMNSEDKQDMFLSLDVADLISAE